MLVVRASLLCPGVLIAWEHACQWLIPSAMKLHLCDGRCPCIGTLVVLSSSRRFLRFHSGYERAWWARNPHRSAKNGHLTPPPSLSHTFCIALLLCRTVPPLLFFCIILLRVAFAILVLLQYSQAVLRYQ